MRRTEKLLLASLVGLVILWKGGPLAYSVVFGAIEDRRATIRSLEQSVASNLERTVELARIQRLWQDRLSRSLPPDPDDATRLYQKWLTDLAERIGVADAEVVPVRTRAQQSEAFIAIRVTAKGVTTLQRLSTLIDEMRRTGLLHRVRNLSISSQGSRPDSPLEFTMTAEALCLRDVPERRTLFPQARLVSALKPDSTQITVEKALAFPTEPPFLIRLDEELLRVTRLSPKAWIVERAVEGTQPAAHAAGSVVEFVPTYQPDDVAEKLLSHNPFAKPLPPRVYTPRLIAEGSRIVYRGSEWKLNCRVADLDPALGPVRFSVSGDVPPGLTIDPATGVLQWQPGDDVPLESHTLVVQAHVEGRSEPLVQEAIEIAVREPNHPPVLAPIGPLVAILGREFELALQATDDDLPNDRLQFQAVSGLPEGARLDPATGLLQWTPRPDEPPRTIELTVAVTDQQGADDRKTLRIEVREDPLIYTKLVATIERDGQWEAWLFDQLNNRRFVVREGETVEHGGLKALVFLIGRGFLLLAGDSGETYRLELGRSLADRVLLPDESPKKPSTPTSATAEEPDRSG